MFSIILCTRNRAPLLRTALESFLGITFPPDAFELCVVDNNSSDDTRQVIADFAACAPFALRYVFEQRPGLSIARNRAIRESTGEFLFFTDDDQLVHPDILREHHRVAQVHGARVIQGAIELVFPAGRPSWLHGPLDVWFGKTGELAEGPSAIDLFGGNMVFHRSLFEGGFAFREDLGKGAAGYSEDSEISRQLRLQGETIVFAPTAIIYHVIDADRATEKFLRTNARNKGYSDGIMGGGRSPLTACVLSLVRTIRQGVTAAMLMSDRHRSVNAQVLACYFAGHARGSIALKLTWR
jgi:glycosyltransferase involved in cell wall biosynthesis